MFPEITRDDVFRIETPRLWLRWHETGDAAAIAAFAGLPEVAKMTATWNVGVSVEEVERRIGQSRELNGCGKALRLVMALKDRPGHAVGQIGVDALPGQRLGLGYHLAPSLWSKGLMSEAVCALVAHAFALTPARLVQAQVRICNRASAKVLEKCGFTSAGLELSDTLVHGRIEKELFVHPRHAQPLLAVA